MGTGVRVRSRGKGAVVDESVVAFGEYFYRYAVLHLGELQAGGTEGAFSPRGCCAGGELTDVPLAS